MTTMEAERSPSTSSEDSFDWIDVSRFRDVAQAKADLASIWRCGATPDLLDMLRDQLVAQFEQMLDLNAALANLARFIEASRSPTVPSSASYPHATSFTPL